MPLFESKVRVEDNTYTKKTNVPQYEPAKSKPPIESLCDIGVYSKLVREIKQSDISDEDKKFLILAASRHIVFNYSRIADYYAHSDPTIQRLFEKSALVLIDIDDAIANGYVRLSKDIDEIMKKSGAHTKE